MYVFKNKVKVEKNKVGLDQIKIKATLILILLPLYHLLCFSVTILVSSTKS